MTEPLTCPQCGNTSPSQPIGDVYCTRTERHPRHANVKMEETTP